MTKQQHEMEVFRGFVVATGLAIANDSITQPAPPKPDVFCRTIDDVELAFELTRIQDTDVARRTAIICVEMDRLRTLVEALPQDARIFKNFNDAMFMVLFHNDSTKTGRKNASETLINFLNSDQPDLRNITSEYVNLPQKPDLDAIEYVLICRGLKGGPFFDTGGGGPYGVPANEAIRQKLRKTYQTNAPLDLIAYRAEQPRPPDETWLPRVIDFAESVVVGSPFERIWIYDHKECEIIYSTGGK